MSHFDEYQLKQLGELFNHELIDETLETYTTLTAQQEAVLQFIAENPDEQFIELQKTFKMPDVLVVNLVEQYGASSDEYNDLRELKSEMRP